MKSVIANNLLECNAELSDVNFTTPLEQMSPAKKFFSKHSQQKNRKPYKEII